MPARFIIGKMRRKRLNAEQCIRDLATSARKYLFCCNVHLLGLPVEIGPGKQQLASLIDERVSSTTFFESKFEKTLSSSNVGVSQNSSSCFIYTMKSRFNHLLAILKAFGSRPYFKKSHPTSLPDSNSVKGGLNLISRTCFYCFRPHTGPKLWPLDSSEHCIAKLDKVSKPSLAPGANYWWKWKQTIGVSRI